MSDWFQTPLMKRVAEESKTKGSTMKPHKIMPTRFPSRLQNMRFLTEFEANDQMTKPDRPSLHYRWPQAESVDDKGNVNVGLTTSRTWYQAKTSPPHLLNSSPSSTRPLL